MDIFCPHIKFKRNVLTCIYKCKLAHKCEAYERAYEKIKEEPIEEKYIQKYGQPVYVVPDGLVRKEKQRLKKEKQQEKNNKIKERLAKKQAKIDAKEEKLAAKAEKTYQREQKKREKEQKKAEREKKKQERYEKLVKKWTPVIESKTPAPPAVIVPSVEKPKRKRRTKAEIEAAKQPVAELVFTTLKTEPKDNIITLKVLKHRNKGKAASFTVDFDSLFDK